MFVDWIAIEASLNRVEATKRNILRFLDRSERDGQIRCRIRRPGEGEHLAELLWHSV